MIYAIYNICICTYITYTHCIYTCDIYCIIHDTQIICIYTQWIRDIVYYITSSCDLREEREQLQNSFVGVFQDSKNPAVQVARLSRLTTSPKKAGSYYWEWAIPKFMSLYTFCSNRLGLVAGQPKLKWILGKPQHQIRLNPCGGFHMLAGFALCGLVLHLRARRCWT